MCVEKIILAYHKDTENYHSKFNHQYSSLFAGIPKIYEFSRIHESKGRPLVLHKEGACSTTLVFLKFNQSDSLIYIDCEEYDKPNERSALAKYYRKLAIDLAILSHLLLLQELVKNPYEHWLMYRDLQATRRGVRCVLDKLRKLLGRGVYCSDHSNFSDWKSQRSAFFREYGDFFTIEKIEKDYFLALFQEFRVRGLSPETSEDVQRSIVSFLTEFMDIFSEFLSAQEINQLIRLVDIQSYSKKKRPLIEKIRRDVEEVEIYFQILCLEIRKKSISSYNLLDRLENLKKLEDNFLNSHKILSESRDSVLGIQAQDLSAECKIVFDRFKKEFLEKKEQIASEYRHTLDFLFEEEALGFAIERESDPVCHLLEIRSTLRRFLQNEVSRPFYLDERFLFFRQKLRIFLDRKSSMPHETKALRITIKNSLLSVENIDRFDLFFKENALCFIKRMQDERFIRSCIEKAGLPMSKTLSELILVREFIKIDLHQHFSRIRKLDHHKESLLKCYQAVNNVIDDYSRCLAIQKIDQQLRFFLVIISGKRFYSSKSEFFLSRITFSKKNYQNLFILILRNIINGRNENAKIRLYGFLKKIATLSDQESLIQNRRYLDVVERDLFSNRINIYHFLRKRTHFNAFTQISSTHENLRNHILMV